MGPERKRRSNVEFVIEEEEINGGDIERYEVSIGPPMVSGRKVKPIHTEDPEGSERTPPGSPSDQLDPATGPHTSPATPSRSTRSRMTFRGQGTGWRI